MLYRCKNCGGNTVYSPEKGTMYCPSCEGTDCEEPYNPVNENKLLCPNCGGELPLQQFTSALKCPYCENYLILDEKVEGAYLPKLIAPFRVGKEKVKEDIRGRFKSMFFVPKDLYSDAKLNDMQGWYVPFWFYDFDANLYYDGEGIHVERWTDKDFEYVERAFYEVHRDMDVSFERIPVDASDAMPDATMDLLAPFNYEDTRDFDSRLLSGFYAEQYNHPAADLQDRGRSQMETAAQGIISESVSKGPEAVYNEHNDKDRRISVNRMDATFGLMPVWKYTYEYHGKDYPFFINGQTGKIVGNPPTATGKVWAVAAVIAVVLTILLNLIFDSMGLALVIGLVVGLIFGAVNSRQAMSGVTTDKMTYVKNGQIRMKASGDRFLRKKLDKQPRPKDNH